MRTTVHRASVALLIGLVPAAVHAAPDHDAPGPGGEPAPPLVDVVGDPDPADGRPRASYHVFDVPDLEHAPSALPAAAPTIFYMNKSGGTYRPGNNDARTNYSSIVSSTRTIPAWNVSASGWNQVMTCMQTMFARWNVTITDQDPGNVPHFEIVVAGRPEHLGMQSGVGGVSPFSTTCGVIPNSIVYTFAEVYGTNYRSICETSAQEIAHSFGLDHEYLCADPMTYLYGCGAKSFQNVDAQCGEYSARQCYCGASRQNSVAMLDARLGLAGPNDPPPDPPDDPQDPPPPPPEDPQDPPQTPPDEPTDPSPPDEPGDPADPADPADPDGRGLVTGGCAAGGGVASGGAVALALVALGARRRRRRR